VALRRNKSTGQLFPTTVDEGEAMTDTNVSSVASASLSDPVVEPVPWRDRSPDQRLAAAQDFLRGTGGSLSDLCDLAFAMKDADKRFTHARRLLLRARQHKDYTAQSLPKRHKILQQLALCTYKDDDLPAERRFNRALEWLKEIAPLEQLGDQESLCLAGAIYKRQWESTGQIACLKQSLGFYHRGYDVAGPATAAYDGYAAINAAFVSDLLALEEAKTSPDGPAVREYRQAADDLRSEIVAFLPPKALGADPESAWWLFVTIAEAQLGLMNYDKAKETLAEALKLPHVYAWQQESTARQLGYLAHIIALRDGTDAQRAYDVIQTGFSLSKEAREAMVLGRVGLALSGGGFRASLFHIGVLARLAELDLLRHVEVLSCVSGGSIIGAYYYLELRSRMIEKSDAEMTPAEYIAIVKRVEEQFLAGVQTNLRSSIPTNIWSDLRMIFDPRYSRTTRIGDLYQSRLFDRAPVPSNAAEEGQSQPIKPKWISDLPFTPKGAPLQFNPKSHNWRRGAKVPMLVLNATTLNTGHNWQFTGTWMGEAASTIENRIDSNDYLRRMYYSEAPEPYTGKGVLLGHAVAASSCVPGLFPALKLPKLYEHHPVVRLVDGGVHDNQGIAALLDQDCNVILVSDASGQMCSEDNPPGGVFGGPSRANSVLQARVRLAQFRELDARKQSGALRGLMWVHLREELEPVPVEWNGSQEPFSREDEGLPDRRPEPLLGYGVHRDIQDALARLRTDLDSFSDAEAHGLMCSAYLMTRWALARDDRPFARRPDRSADWKFLTIEPHLKSPESFRTPVARALRVGEQLPLKAWRLSPVLAGISTVAILGLGLVLAYVLAAVASRMGWIDAAATGMKSPAIVVAVTGAVGAVVAVLRWTLRTYGRVGELVERGTIGVLTVALFGPMWIHRKVFDPIFLRRGRYERT
jgi:predicted acylesterase/phospholipase RssA